MIMQILLITILVFAILYALTQKKRAFAVSMAMVAVSIVGCILVLFPNLANAAAQVFGVGRGADLILYCFVVISMVSIFNIHLRLRSEHENLTKLARAVAILGAREPTGQD